MAEVRPRIAELLSFIDDARARLLETATQINPSFAAISPRDGAWSAAETLSHLAKVEEGVSWMVERSVQWARTNGIGPDPSDESLLGRLDSFTITDSPKKRIAPETVAPEGNVPIEQSLASLEASRRRLTEALIAGSDLDLSVVKRPHQAVGELDMYQWTLFVALHEERHRRQIERTVAEVTERAAECAPIV